MNKRKLTGEHLLLNLIAISNKMTEIRTLTPLLSYVMAEVLPLVHGERGYIVLIDQETGELTYRAKKRSGALFVTDQPDIVSRSVLDEVLQTRQSLLISNALEDKRFYQAKSVVQLKLRSIMCTPLITKNVVIGAIYVENRTESNVFDEQDIIPLEFFSNQAAVAIENAHINDNLQSLVDAQTKQLADAEQIRRNILADISHELRTPLTGLEGTLRAMLDGVFDLDAEYTANMYNQVQHLNRLVEDLHLLSLAETNQLRLEITSVDMFQVMQHLVQTFAISAQAEGIELKYKIEEVPIIEGDVIRIRQILSNLLSNAIRYTPANGSVFVEMTYINHQVQILIQDTGKGILAKDLPYIFDRFYRADPSRTRATGGSGLGLAITKALTNVHGGTLSASSAGLEQGTCFTLVFPII